MEATTDSVFDVRLDICRVLVVSSASILAMTLEIKLSDRLYRSLERMATALESINRTLVTPPEDFTSEDEVVKASTKDVVSAEHAVHDAQERIPHGAETTN